MFKALKEFFFGKPAAPQAEAPYKVETPTPALIISQVPEAAAYTVPVVEEAAAPAEVKPAKKPRAKKPAEAKPVAEKKPAAPRKPRAKKAPTA